MRKIRHVLRLAWGVDLSRRQIARSLNVSPTTVGQYLQRAQTAGLSWPLPETLDDGELEARLFSQPAPLPPASRPLPQWAHVHCELKRKGVTLWLLWQEYKAAQPDGLQYSQFCERYRRYVGGLDLVMRQRHRAGETLFVDYAGQTVAVVGPASGEIRPAQIFVATLGASNYTYAEATWTQSLPDWIGAHIRALEFLGAVPAVLTPDNLKSGVRRTHRYEPDINPTYAALAAHYGSAIVPARSKKPRDKAKVENAVLVVERWVLARLRHCTFFSLAELNAAIAALIPELNARPFKKLPGSRRTLFETLDRPAMNPCRARALSMPSGRRCVCTWIITSRSKAITTPCPTNWLSTRSRLGSRPTPWSCCTAASGWRAIDAPRKKAVIPRLTSICRGHTAPTPAGG